MLKREKGVTLTILVVTIIVMLILAGVIMSINMNLNKTTDLKEVVSNMELIKMIAADYRNKYISETVVEIDENNNKIVTISDKFKGTHLDPQNASDIIMSLLGYSNKTQLGIDETGYYWFRLDKKDLEEIGIDNIKDNELYFVNYQTLDIAYCKNERDSESNYKGVKAVVKTAKGKKEKYVYFYSELKNVKTDEVRD